jgi:hypothetical protein
MMVAWTMNERMNEEMKRNHRCDDPVLRVLAFQLQRVPRVPSIIW